MKSVVNKEGDFSSNLMSSTTDSDPTPYIDIIGDNKSKRAESVPPAISRRPMQDKSGKLHVCEYNIYLYVAHLSEDPQTGQAFCPLQ